MTISIYSPAVHREAQLFGITDLQAWRKLNARDALRERERGARRSAPSTR